MKKRWIIFQVILGILLNLAIPFLLILTIKQSMPVISRLVPKIELLNDTELLYASFYLTALFVFAIDTLGSTLNIFKRYDDYWFLIYKCIIYFLYLIFAANSTLEKVAKNGENFFVLSFSIIIAVDRFMSNLKSLIYKATAKDKKAIGELKSEIKKELLKEIKSIDSEPHATPSH